MLESEQNLFLQEERYIRATRCFASEFLSRAHGALEGDISWSVQGLILNLLGGSTESAHCLPSALLASLVQIF